MRQVILSSCEVLLKGILRTYTNSSKNGHIFPGLINALSLKAESKDYLNALDKILDVYNSESNDSSIYDKDEIASPYHVLLQWYEKQCAIHRLTDETVNLDLCRIMDNWYSYHLISPRVDENEYFQPIEIEADLSVLYQTKWKEEIIFRRIMINDGEYKQQRGRFIFWSEDKGVIQGIVLLDSDSIMSFIPFTTTISIYVDKMKLSPQNTSR